MEVSRLRRSPSPSPSRSNFVAAELSHFEIEGQPAGAAAGHRRGSTNGSLDDISGNANASGWGGPTAQLEHHAYLPGVLRAGGLLTPFPGHPYSCHRQLLRLHFRQDSALAFNVTQGADPTSRLLGFMRGYTVQASSTADFHGVEVEVLTYDDGSLNGTISLQCLINVATNEIAIVGGSGDFRGARGYAVITFLNSTAALSLYKHQLFFL
ncbi:hypothetical protein L7F22_024498 [Adiantum nelumboides]|nr:hypothetical protein [Adiantum nelumboides]